MDHKNTETLLNDYKERKDAFISGFEGTTITEINILLVCFPLVYYSYLTLTRLFRTQSHDRSRSVTFIIDYLVLVLLPLLQMTFLNNYLKITCFLLVILATVCYFLKTTYKKIYSTSQLHYSDLQWLKSIILKQRLSSLAYYRVALIICTVICILAVDFHIFPRRFAKVEKYGSGLMDVGVGFFIFSSAITSPSSRVNGPIKEYFGRTLRSVFPLFILGLIRFASVKATAYHEHASEYGVHWNFFLTLAFTKVLCSLLLKFIPNCNTTKLYLLSTAVLAAYQMTLSMGLSHFIHNISYNQAINNSVDFIKLNAPGIASLFGYISLHLYGMACGRLLLHERNKRKQLSVLLFQLVLFTLMTAIAMTTVEDISRQLANASYVLWQVSINILLVIAFQLAVVIHSSSLDLTLSSEMNRKQTQVSFENRDQVFKTVNLELSNRSKLTVDKNRHDNHNYKYHLEVALGLDYPLIITALNDNQLLCFLFANLLTGAVNLTIQTISVSDITALFILTVYTIIVCLTLTIMKFNNINTKIW